VRLISPHSGVNSKFNIAKIVAIRESEVQKNVLSSEGGKIVSKLSSNFASCYASHS
jgi:hypothetical protein